MEERKEGLSTYSVKVDPDIKTLLQTKIEESGKTAGDFISALLATYETSQNRESIYNVRELNQLKNHLARIEEIYVSLAKSRKDLEESSHISVSTLQEELRAVKADLYSLQKSSADEITNLQAVATNEVEEARKQAEIALAEFAKLTEAKERAEKQADAMTDTLEQQKNLIAELREAAADAKSNANIANDNAQQLKNSYSVLLQDFDKLKNQLITESAQAQIDKANAVNEALKESSQEIRTLHERIDSLQNDKLKLMELLAIEREKIARLEAQQVEKAPRTREPREPKQK